MNSCSRLGNTLPKPRLSLALVVLAWFALTPDLPLQAAPAQEPPLRLKVMTYNIRIGAGGGEWPTDPRRINLEPVARVIEQQAPDLVGVQEVDQFRSRSAGMDQPKWLSERLGMQVAFVPAYTVPVAGAHDERYGVALLARQPIPAPDRLPLYKPDYRKSHPQYPGYYSEQRVLLIAPVRVGAWQIHLFVTHLGLTSDQRQRQVKDIVDAAARIPGPKILMGDFNAEPTEPAMTQLRASFQDALAAVGATAEERKSFPAGLHPKGAIDYIFVSTDFRILKAQVLRDATVASDHNPVLAELELPPSRDTATR